MVRAALAEAAGTFLLVLVGTALAAGVLLGGPVGGGAGNPGRALGPMLVSGTYPSVIIHVLGPLVGGILAAVLYDHVVGEAEAPQTPVADAGKKSANGARSADGGARE